MSARRDHRPWNDEERASLRRAYDDPTLTLDDKADLLGRSRQAVAQEASRLGYTRPRRADAPKAIPLDRPARLPWTPERREEFRRLYLDPATTGREVAERMTLTMAAVYNEAKRMGLTKPPPPPRTPPLRLVSTYDWSAHAAELRRRGIGEATVRAMLASVGRVA